MLKNGVHRPEERKKNEKKSPQQLTLIQTNSLNLLHLRALNAPIPSENSIRSEKKVVQRNKSEEFMASVLKKPNCLKTKREKMKKI